MCLDMVYILYVINKRGKVYVWGKFLNLYNIFVILYFIININKRLMVYD